VPAPAQVSVEPSPNTQLVDTGTALAVTDSPGTATVLVRGVNDPGPTHNHVGKPTT